MTREMSSEDTRVVATYSARHDAEVAKSYLEDVGIASFVVADDVHPPIQLTGGVRLFVMSGEADHAREALVRARMTGEQAAAGEHDADRPEVVATQVGKPARMASWVYVIGFLLIVLAIIAGLLFSV